MQGKKVHLIHVKHQRIFKPKRNCDQYFKMPELVTKFCLPFYCDCTLYMRLGYIFSCLFVHIIYGPHPVAKFKISVGETI